MTKIHKSGKLTKGCLPLARHVLIISLLATGASHATAQSSVTLAGQVSSGLNYASNIKGHSDYYVSPAGVARPNVLLFQGNEDLGGGLKALFLLSQSFSTANGTNSGGTGALWSRESYVGLGTPWGTVTLGQQRDFMFDLTIAGYTGSSYSGIVGGHQGPFPTFGVPWAGGGSQDFDRLNGEALNNTVKFKSANFQGLTFGAMYSFGNQAGSFGV